MLNNFVPVAITFSEFLSEQIRVVVVLVGMDSTVVDDAKDPCGDAFQLIVT